MDDSKVQAEQEERAVRDLTRGTWVQLIDGDGDDFGEVEVLHVESDDDDGEWLMVYRSRGGSPESIWIGADLTVPVLSADRLAEAKAFAERAKRVANIRAFADWLEANPAVPAPWGMSAYEHWHVGENAPDVATGIARLRSLADQLGVKVDESRSENTDFTVPFGDVEYRLIFWHKDGRPVATKPEPVAEAHPSWPTEQELKPWETLAPAAAALAESVKRIDPDSSMEAHYDAEADPIGLNYGRGDEGESTPLPASRRFDPHTGGMTADGLVDDDADDDEGGFAFGQDDDKPLHFLADGTSTVCGMAWSAMPRGEGYTSDRDAVTCPACVNGLS